MEQYAGKALIRRSKLGDGTPVLIICGVFRPSDSIENYSAADEMWAAKFLLTDVKKFEAAADTPMVSPEDFLENMNYIQDPRCWKPKNDQH